MIFYDAPSNMIHGLIKFIWPQSFLFYLECSGVLDIVFIVDISGSIRRETFGDVIEEMIKIVKNLEVDKDKVS